MGRSEKKCNRIELRLCESDIKKLDEIALADGVTRSACIRSMIDTQYFFRRDDIMKIR